jgi:cytochrome P450
MLARLHPLLTNLQPDPLDHISTTLTVCIAPAAADWPPTVKQCLGEKAVSIVHGKEHLMLRKALAPLFSPAAIRGYMPQVQAIAEACVSSWLKQGDIKGRPRTCASSSGCLQAGLQ